MAIRGMVGVLWVAGTAAVVADPAWMPADEMSTAPPAAGVFVPASPVRIGMTAGTAGLRLTAGFPCRP